MRAIAAVTFTQVDPAADVEPLVAFLTTNSFPFHRVPRVTEEQARAAVLGGRYWSGDSVCLWIDAADARIGIAVIDELADVGSGGNPVFDLRLAEAHRGRGFGVSVLTGLTELVFTRWPDVTRFEGQTREDNLAMRATFRGAGWVQEAFYRDAWPIDGGDRLASIGYAVLRRDWESGNTTPVVWDDR